MVAGVARLMADWPRSFHALVQTCEAVNSRDFPPKHEYGNFRRFLLSGMPKQDCAFVFKEYDEAVRALSGPDPTISPKTATKRVENVATTSTPLAK